MEKLLALMIPILALMIPIIAIYLKHQRVMAGVESADGKKSATGTQARTLAVLTETLERQHERLRGLTARVETLEAVLTDEQRAAFGAALAEAVPADAPLEARREPATAPVLPRTPRLGLPDADDALPLEEAVVQRNRDRA